MFPRRASTEARRKRSSGRPDPPTPSMTVWFLQLEDLSLQQSAPSTFDLNLILIKSTFAQSFIAQQVIRLSATKRVRQSASPL
jgi:hypothetical protein